MDVLVVSLVGFFASCIGSVAGGGGVLTVPTLLAFGIPPINTLLLNKLTVFGIIGGSFRNYYKSRSIDWKLALSILFPLSIGAFLGASIVVRLPEDVLKYVILGGVLVAILLLLKKPTVPEKTGRQRGLGLMGTSLMTLAGMWKGALGMGGATFATLIMVYFARKTFLQARSTDVVAAVPDTLIAVVVLAFGATVSWDLMLAMLISSTLGAWVGSHLAVKHGSDFVRKAMTVIAVAMVIKVLAGV